MNYRIKELNANSFMPQRSADNTTWHDGVPVPATSLPLAHAYVASMREFDAKDTPGVVVWNSSWEIRKPLERDPIKPVMRFEDFLH